MLMGGRSQQREVRDFADARGLMDYTVRLFPAIVGRAVDACVERPGGDHPDYHIHMHEPAENVHICLGYNGRGIAMATAMEACSPAASPGPGARTCPCRSPT